MSGAARELDFEATSSSGRVSGLLLAPENARVMFVMAHGAGAGMRHAFMESMADRLAQVGVASFRYQFPYTEARRKRPDPVPVLLKTVRSAVAAAAEAAPGLRLVAGGKSMGGRMTSMAAAAEPLPGVRGLVFLGFPLHAAGKPGAGRADHLSAVDLPILFLQGTRDPLARLELLRPVCTGLGSRATLHVVDGADHSFKLPKKLGRNAEEIMGELARVIVEWVSTIPDAG